MRVIIRRVGPLSWLLGFTMKIFFMLMTLMPLALAASSQDLDPTLVGTASSKIRACSSSGITLQRLNLRVGPGLNYKVSQILMTGQQLHICGLAKNEHWYPVVLAADGAIECKVLSPAHNPIQYTGPCSSGWVYASKVKITRG